QSIADFACEAHTGSIDVATICPMGQNGDREVRMATFRDKLGAFDPGLPLEKARTIPSSWYFDAEIYEAERRRVFGGSWQMSGRSAQVAAPRSFLTTDIAGEPILVVR